MSTRAGPVVWFTGLSGAGKSTLADRLVKEWLWRGERAALLDGDAVRRGISIGLGFSDEDRLDNIFRIASVAAVLSEAGVHVAVAAISPTHKMRSVGRHACANFTLVYCQASLTTLRERDTKGLHRAQAEGRLIGLTGVDAVYEEPTDAEVVCRCDVEDAATSLAKVLAFVDAPQRHD